MMLVASGLIVQMVFWMRRHGRTLQARPRDEHADQRARPRTGGACSSSSRSRSAARARRRSCSSTAWARSTRARGTSLQVLALGLAAGLADVLGCCSRAASIFSWRTFFRVSEILLLLLAGALLVSAVEKLIALDVLPALVDPVWDTSAVLDDSSRVGGLVAALTGYRARPALLPLLAARRVLGGARHAAARESPVTRSA